jgi:asparagine synthase (glutamine-hydrolysing)
VGGIAGKLDFGAPVDEGLIRRMGATMEHRGPDSGGLHLGRGVGLAAQRLATVDVEGGDQPLYNEDRTVVVVMNGQIYNHDELRRELLAKGHRFSSASDTEVLVHLYEEHGRELASRLRGTFAFAIWDEARRQLVCGRDRVGKKPLFYARTGSRFWFASELRALLVDPEIDRQVDPRALREYLALVYVPDPLCAFAGVERVPPASTLTVGAEKEGQQIARYWRLDFSRKLVGVPRAELEERLRAMLWEATRLRLGTERLPLGAFISGGIDSSVLLAAIMDQGAHPVKTFSTGFDDPEFDERGYARMIAERFGTEHHELRVGPDAVEVIPELAAHYGQPFADPSAVPTFCLARLAAGHVRVALNGDAADTSLAGSPKYANNEMVARYFDPVPRPVRRAAAALLGVLGEGPHRQSLRGRVRRRARLVAMSRWERFLAWMSAFDVERRRQVLTPEFQVFLDEGSDDIVAELWRSGTASNLLDRMLEVDAQTYLPSDLMVKMDVATMANSLEARSPFTDHKLMELAAALPPELKLDGRNHKRILKSAARGLIPDEVIDRPKMGFTVPLRRWLRAELRDLPGDVLLDPRSIERGCFRRNEVKRMIREHRSGAVDHSLPIWVMIQLEMWHREVVEKPAGRQHAPA